MLTLILPFSSNGLIRIKQVTFVFKNKITFGKFSGGNDAVTYNHKQAAVWFVFTCICMLA